ncbi:DUF4391 domain-containing protein [Fonticella tunisiensis]|nr:DUF4391 domain-containing protein [Fonticella tunisiensis]
MWDFFNFIELDKKVRPVNIKIDKKTIYENIDLSSSERKIIAECIEKIEIAYVLNSKNINIQPYSDENMKYESIAFIGIKMRKKEKVERIAEILNCSIPNPIALVFEFEESILIATALKRLSKIDKNRAVFEKINLTDWINLDNIDDLQLQFINAIKMSNLPYTDFYEFYSAIDEAVFLINNSCIVKQFKISQNEEERIHKKDIIENIKSLEEKLAKIQIRINKEKQFNKKLELNIEASKIKDDIEGLKMNLN